jgi:hypothetical protein
MVEETTAEAMLLALGVKAEQLPWAHLGRVLGVDAWQSADGPVSPSRPRPAGAPSWYADEETESQRMLGALGFQLGGRDG